VQVHRDGQRYYFCGLCGWVNLLEDPSFDIVELPMTLTLKVPQFLTSGFSVSPEKIDTPS